MGMRVESDPSLGQVSSFSGAMGTAAIVVTPIQSITRGETVLQRARDVELYNAVTWYKPARRPPTWLHPRRVPAPLLMPCMPCAALRPHQAEAPDPRLHCGAGALPHMARARKTVEVRDWDWHAPVRWRIVDAGGCVLLHDVQEAVAQT